VVGRLPTARHFRSVLEHETNKLEYPKSPAHYCKVRMSVAVVWPIAANEVPIGAA